MAEDASGRQLNCPPSNRQRRSYAKQQPVTNAAGIALCNRQRIAIGRSPSWLS
jgi:hypothetical protein